VGDKIVLKGRLDKQRGSPSLRVDSVLDPLRLKIKSELRDYCASGHPLDDYAEAWEQFVRLDLSKPEQAAEGEYTLIGILTSLRPITTKSGKDMAFASLSDFRGEIDLVFFARAWEFNRDRIEENRCIAVKGKLDKSREKPSFQVSSVLETAKLKRKAAKTGGEAEPEGAEPSPAAPPAASYREVHIRLRETAAEQDENLYPLRDYLLDNPGPCAVFIHVPGSGGETVIRTATQLSAAGDASRLDALTRCSAVAQVWGE
jgi:DNA polymerase-3 subunit alpha